MHAVGYPTMLRVRRVDQHWCAQIDSFFSRPFVYGQSYLDALRRLYEHPSCAPWQPRIARVIADYNLGFGPITDADLAAGVNLATILPKEEPCTH